MLWGTYTTGIPVLRAKKSENTTLKRVLHGGGGPQVGEVTRLGGVTRLSNNCQHCWMLRFVSVSTPCVARIGVLLGVVAQSLKTVKRSTTSHKQTHQVPTLSGQQCWELLGPFARSVISLLGVLASVCRQLPTRTQQVPTLSGQQCW